MRSIPTYEEWLYEYEVVEFMNESNGKRKKGESIENILVLIKRTPKQLEKQLDLVRKQKEMRFDQLEKQNPDLLDKIKKGTSKDTALDELNLQEEEIIHARALKTDKEELKKFVDKHS